jgi:hypothetical protein
MAFNRNRVVELVTDFYRANDAEADTKFVVMLNLEDALRIAVVHGPDARLAGASVRQTARTIQDLDDDRRVLGGIHELVFGHVIQRDPDGRHAIWLEQAIVMSAGYARVLPGPLGDACRNGLGWLIAANRTAIMVPTPIVRLAEGRSDVIHDDSGRMAVIWPDGHGYYFLQGSEFDKRLYFQVINHDLLIQDIAALDNADQRAIALQYLTFEQLVLDSDAELVERGVRGTALYRLPLPPRIARDRKPNYGRFDYFIHMRDASHPEREFIEWVDPEIGKQRNAELCQAHAFGVSLDDWLSIQQEG